MEWFRFSHLRRDQPAPAFRLLSAQGMLVAPSDFHGRRNLVLLFLPDLNDPGCRAALENFAAHRREYEEQAAQVLVILTNPNVEAALERAQAFSFPILADPDGAVRQAYAALLPAPVEDEPLVFVLDRYRGPQVALAGHDLDDPDLHREILKWLTFFEIQCPECGAPEWPVD
ncbi:MAG: redoxin domain-containing protein [Anaerolineae bacterium]|nr:peroxiredoxin family protein [Anaerolineae bacterium]MDW7990625.1 redoxin domain-containing protein [Anaerolineae bacterium]